MSYKELVSKYGRGLMSHVQYTEIAKELEPHCPCNLLVFGLGDDSHLWQNLNINGVTVFLEDDQSWIDKILNKSTEDCSYFESTNELTVHHINYKTKIQDYHQINLGVRDDSFFDEEEIKIDLPSEVTDVLWDFIIVDGPLGHQPPRPYNGPGRMSSIFSAYSLIKEDGIIVIDDYNRGIEKTYSDHYFGKENLFKMVEGKVGFFKNAKKR